MGTSIATTMRLMELGVNAAQLHMNLARTKIWGLGLDDGSMENKLVITNIFFQWLTSIRSRISRRCYSTPTVFGDDDDDHNELAIALLELSKSKEDERLLQSLY